MASHDAFDGRDGEIQRNWWAMRASIPRLLRCERSALPTELIALGDL